MDNYAHRLVSLEEDLNNIKVKGAPIGGLFGRLFLILYNDDKSRLNDLNKVYIIPAIIFKSFTNKKIKRLSSKRDLLFGILSDRKNFSKLIEPFIEAYPDRYFIYGPKNKGNGNGFSFDDTPNLSLKACLVILCKALNIYPGVYKKFKKHNVECNRLSIFNNLYSQLLRMQSASLIIENFKIFITDCDRTYPMAPFVLAANAKGVKTVTLIHGEIFNYGYNPILADEVWCWGAKQREKLISLEVDPEKIKIVGNPAIEDRKSLRMPGNTNFSSNPSQVVVGIILTRNNKEILEYVMDLEKTLPNSITLLYKKHPFMDTEEELEFDKNSNYNSFKGKDNYEFFENCDLILTCGSSMSYEAILNNTPIVLLDIYKKYDFEKELKNMGNLIAAPLFNDPENCGEYIQKVLFSPKKYTELLKGQKVNVQKHIYYKVGENASKEILAKFSCTIQKHQKGFNC